MPRVSVIMPAYNHAAFVRQAVESVLSQSFADLELLVVDDASSDRTPDVLRSVTDPRLKLDLLARNGGASAAVNSALRRAGGDYIAILNSDDYFLPRKIERQVHYLDTHPGVAAVFGLPHFVDEQGKPLADDKNPFRRLFETRNMTRHEWLRRFFVIGNALCHPTVLIRRSCYEQLGDYDARLAQLPDFDLWIRVCSRHDIHILGEPVTAYRVLDGERNASGGHPQSKVRHDWELQYVLRRYLDLPDHELRQIFAGEFRELDPDGRQRPKVTLAHLALKLAPSAWASASYVAFGLDTLHHALTADTTDISPREYMRLTGTHAALNLGHFQSSGSPSTVLELEVELARSELRALRSSTSWRVTEPLRFLAAKARAISGGDKSQAI